MNKRDVDAEGKEQADKFRDLARELECDEDEARFEETVKKVAGGGPTQVPPVAPEQSRK